MILKTWNIILTICVIVYPFVSILREAVTNIFWVPLVTAVMVATVTTVVVVVMVVVVMVVVATKFYIKG